MKSDAETITFAATRPEELRRQIRLVRVAVRDANSDVHLGQVPDWLECKILSREGKKVMISLKITDRPPKPFASTNLRITQGSSDSPVLLLPIRVFAAQG